VNVSSDGPVWISAPGSRGVILKLAAGLGVPTPSRSTIGAASSITTAVGTTLSEPISWITTGDSDLAVIAARLGAASPEPVPTPSPHPAPGPRSPVRLLLAAARRDQRDSRNARSQIDPHFNDAVATEGRRSLRLEKRASSAGQRFSKSPSRWSPRSNRAWIRCCASLHVRAV